MSQTIDTQTIVASLKSAITLIETHFGKKNAIKVPDDFEVDTVPALSFDKQMKHIRANNEALAGLVDELKEMASERGLE